MKQNLARFSFGMAQLDARKKHFSVSFSALRLDRSVMQSKTLFGSVTALLTDRQRVNLVSVMNQFLSELAYRKQILTIMNRRWSLLSTHYRLHTRHNGLLRNSG